MIAYLRRAPMVVLVSLCAQAVFFGTVFSSPNGVPGPEQLWLAVFPGFILAWAAVHSLALPLAVIAMVVVSLIYHLIIDAVLSLGWRSVRTLWRLGNDH